MFLLHALAIEVDKMNILVNILNNKHSKVRGDLQQMVTLLPK